MTTAELFTALFAALVLGKIAIDVIAFSLGNFARYMMERRLRARREEPLPLPVDVRMSKFSWTEIEEGMIHLEKRMRAIEDLRAAEIVEKMRREGRAPDSEAS